MTAGPSPCAMLAIAFLAAVSQLKQAAAVHTVISDTRIASSDQDGMPAAARIATTNQAEIIVEAPPEAASGAAGLKSYHSTPQTFSMMQKLEKSCNVHMKTRWVNDTEGKGKLFVVDLGHPKAEKKVMIAANEHAREMLTSEVVLRFVQRVCGKSSKQASLLEETDANEETGSVAEMFKHVKFTIIPIVNEKGRILVEKGIAPCQRMTTKEEGEVDLNRNMDVDWGKGDVQPWGEKPFSTYQARILRDLAKDVQPVAYIDLHTGDRDLMTSYGFKRKVSGDYGDQKKMLDEVKQKHCMDCKMGPNSVVIGYPNPGEIIDHMYVKEGIKYTSLWELYGGTRDSCIKMFNPPDSLYEEHVENWSGALLTVGHFVNTKVNVKERSNPTELDWNETSASLLDSAATESLTEPATIGALTTS